MFCLIEVAGCWPVITCGCFYSSASVIDKAPDKRGVKKLFFLFPSKNICCDPSLEPSRRDGSNDGSQNMFL